MIKQTKLAPALALIFTSSAALANGNCAPTDRVFNRLNSYQEEPMAIGQVDNYQIVIFDTPAEAVNINGEPINDSFSIATLYQSVATGKPTWMSCITHSGTDLEFFDSQKDHSIEAFWSKSSSTEPLIARGVLSSGYLLTVTGDENNFSINTHSPYRDYVDSDAVAFRGNNLQ